MFDSVLGWGFGAVLLALGLGVAWAMGRVLGIGTAAGHNVAVDGLRGYLAFGVLLHHSVVWYFFLRRGEWALPPESVYRALGTHCVSLFFMITGYLFVGKLIDARKKPIDWTALYVSRVLRLTPLYLVAIAALLTLVGIQTDWERRVPWSELAVAAAHWVGFTVITAPDVNGLASTAVLIAVVTWSLAYEWLFYLSLPAQALLLRLRVPWGFLVVCSVACLWLILEKQTLIFPTSFVKGAIAAALSRWPPVASWLARPLFAPLALVLLVAGAAELVPPPMPAIFITLAFFAVACGNTMFGLLSNRAAVVLGDISYGVYLLHGLVFSTTFFLLLDPAMTATLTPLQHWAVVSGVATVVVSLAAVSYRYLELPAMQRVRPVTARLHRAWLAVRRPRSAPTA